MDIEVDRDLTLLQLVPEILPTHRPDVYALFGQYLPRAGIRCHIVGRGATAGGASSDVYSRQYLSRGHGPRLLREISYWLLCLRRLARAKKEGVDLVQVRDMVTIGLAALIAARIWRLPFTYWMSFPMCEDRIERARRLWRDGRLLRAVLLFVKGWTEHRLLYRVLLPASDHVFVQSDAMQAMLLQRGLSAKRITPVPMGVDMEKLASRPLQPERAAGWETASVFAYLGTLDPCREVTTMVSALSVVRRRYPNVRLLLIGDTTHTADREHLWREIATLGEQDHVRITGWLDPTEAWQLASGADACISYYPRSHVLDVGSPTKLLEYLALGMPSVANDNPDQQHVLQDSDAGWLCASSAPALAEAMCDLLRDLPAARHRARRGVEFVQRRRSYAVLSVGVAQRYLTLAGRFAADTAHLSQHAWASRTVETTQTKSSN